MIVWLYVIAYFAIGCMCALDVGMYVHTKLKAKARAEAKAKVARYPLIYGDTITDEMITDEIDPFGVIGSIVGGFLAWPVVWPVATITRMVLNGQEHEDG